MSDQPQYDVFLAHNSQDKPQVRAVAKELRQRGMKPWLDEDVIAPGRWFQDVIQQAVPDVKSAAIFIGLGGLGTWEAVELRAFISQCVEAHIPVIPVLLPGVNKLPTHLLFLNQLNWVRFTSGIDDVEALDNLEWGITGRKPESTFQANSQVTHNYRNPSTVEQPTPPTPNPPDRPKSQRLHWLTSGAIFLIGLAGLAGFQVRGQTELFNSRYIYLENLLSEKRWKEADRETANRMWEVAGKWEERSLQAKDYDNFSCEDLRTIDNLWTKYSKGRFGFSIQRQIWESSDVSRDLGKFGIRVGWMQRNEDGGIFYIPVTNFSLNAREGELPWIVNWQGSGDRNAYMSRIIGCNIQYDKSISPVTSWTIPAPEN